MPKVLVVVPFALDEEGVANREAQKSEITLGPDIEFHYEPVKAGPAFLDSQHDWMLGDLANYEAAVRAQERGYDAVCIDTMSDSGVKALRSVLDIPVIGPARSSYLTALLLADKFSVLTIWDAWMPVYWRGIHELGLSDHCASVRSINKMPDLRNLLGGSEDEVFPLLREAGLKCVEDGAEVVCLGSTTMHGSHAYLSEQLPVPVINPGPLTYKIAEMLLGLRLSQSRVAYPKPRVPKPDMIEAMLRAAVEVEAQSAQG
jgi:allantoin racemase